MCSTGGRDGSGPDGAWRPDWVTGGELASGEGGGEMERGELLELQEQQAGEKQAGKEQEKDMEAAALELLVLAWEGD